MWHSTSWSALVSDFKIKHNFEKLEWYLSYWWENDVSPDDLDAIFHGAFDEKPDNPNISERVVNESSYLAR